MPRLLHMLILVSVVASYAEGQVYSGPKALGPFRIDKDVPMTAMFQQLGRPSTTLRDTYCYKSSDSRAFLVLTRMVEVYDRKIAGDVLLSSFRNCVNMPVQTTGNGLASWHTEKGVGLGAMEKFVRKAYGQPSSEEKIQGTAYRWVIRGTKHGNENAGKPAPEVGDRVLVYRGAPNDLNTAEFGMRDGKVVWISLSKNE